MGYPNDVLSTRAVIKHGRYALIPPEGRVQNVLPNLEKCNTSIIASPQLGAQFALYTIEVLPGGGTTRQFREEGIETFVFCISGQGKVTVHGKEYEITDGGFVFAPESYGVDLANQNNKPWKLLVYKQRYRVLSGYQARVIVGNINDIPDEAYDNMENVRIKNLLPSELGFDVNFHTLSFYPGGCHPFVETHVQEHGLYFLEGEGMYLIDDKWIPVKTEDFIWFGPYVPQAFYGTGRTNATYIYTKDCNRDVIL
ncbi:MAG: cupin domain-containing protein [Peptococcaceae bacterium]|nr:cupin domain-containing protein [Peptococcaceae bacterium]